MDTVLQDLRYAVRTLAKSPGFTIVAVLTLALGIGANTAIFSVFYGVLLRPLPYAEPERIVGLAQKYAGAREARSVTYVQFQFLERNNQVFESLAGSASVGFNFSTGTQTDRVYGLRVSKDYFRVLSVVPALGRTFFAEEDQPNGPSAVILSYGLWQRRFGGDSGVIGRTILLDGTPTIVAGVMPLDFRAPNGAEAWSTLAQVGRTVGGGSNVTVIGRLRSATDGPPYLGERRPRFCPVGRAEVEWHHACYDRWRAVEQDRATDHARVAAEPALPQAVTQDHGARAVRLVLLGEECATQRWHDAEDPEVVLRDAQAVDAVRLCAGREIEAD